MNSLKIVQEYFPEVTSVKDAKEPITVEVTKADNSSAKVRNHKACAMAVACKRKMQAAGVIVSVATAYVIQGNHATRYQLPESVSREVVSFDRDAGFAPGEYTMIPFTESRKLGTSYGSRGGNREIIEPGKLKKQRKHHKTTGIRTVLGSKLQ